MLKDLSFGSSNDRGFIPLLKDLGFLSPDGKPTNLYHEYRDHSKSKAVMAQALQKAYGDIFLIKARPADSDRSAIQGKFKSYHNVGDNLASLMMKTFYALLKLADLDAGPPKKSEGEGKEIERPSKENGSTEDVGREHFALPGGGLHYNIQIHLPATKDVEVYNAIFKSLKEHLLEE